MLVTSIFSFSHNVFKYLLSTDHEIPGLFSKQSMNLLKELFLIPGMNFAKLGFTGPVCLGDLAIKVHVHHLFLTFFQMANFRLFKTERVFR